MTRRYYANVRMAAIQILGGKCVRCGFSDPRALQADHINGGGIKDRKITTTYPLHIIKSVMNKENKFQLLCANCNWIKRAEQREVRK